MKKIICLLLFALTVHSLYARKFYFIPQAGLNFANTTNTAGGFNPGLNYGITTEYMFTPEIAAETGIGYSMQGSRFKFASTNLSNDYLLIPLLGKYYAYKGLNFFAGPQLGVKVMGNKLAIGGEHEGLLIDNNMVKTIDYSVVLGAGYLLNTGLMFSAKINIGLSNIAKDSFSYGHEIFKTDNKSYRNMVLQFNFGYRF